MKRKSALIFLFLWNSVFFSACSRALSEQASANNEKIHQRSVPDILPAVERYINCLNAYNTPCLTDLYAENYKSYSPILTPADLASFVRETIENLRRNNFEVAVRIKDIDQGKDRASVIMDWQLRKKGTATDSDPFANVQRIDLWKLDDQNNWRIFRTVIYNERAF